MASMAEINARREARRRRILENSENRLRKIIGVVNPVEIEDNNTQVERVLSLAAKLNCEEDRNGIRNVTSNTILQDYTRFNDDEHENFFNDASDRNISSPEQPSKSKFMLHSLLLSRINLVLLAGIVNILLVLKLDNLFGQAVIIPYYYYILIHYTLLLLMRRLHNGLLHEARDGSILIPLLMLCNVNPRLINIFKISFMLFIAILTDFSLYMFSFILMRYGIIHYYLNGTIPENTITNK